MYDLMIQIFETPKKGLVIVAIIGFEDNFIIYTALHYMQII